MTRYRLRGIIKRNPWAPTAFAALLWASLSVWAAFAGMILVAVSAAFGAGFLVCFSHDAYCIYRIRVAHARYERRLRSHNRAAWAYGRQTLEWAFVAVNEELKDKVVLQVVRHGKPKREEMN